ncbi:MAG: hypothetical protein ACI4KA_03340 [Oscillospiraceae bacterium]
MIEKLKRFYSAFGDRGIMFLLFAFSVVIHALLSLNMQLPAVNPDEIGVASIAAFYSGRDWSQLMSSVGYYYGYVQALFYAPLVVVFKSPYALYKAMLVVNGVIISFIPMIAYHLAFKLGITKVWHKSVVALCSGFYITYIAHTKFIWNEAICSLLPWALIWCIYMAWDRKNKYSKFTFSMLAGFTCALCFAAHSRLIAVVAALVVTLLIARFVFKEKILNLPTFFITAAVSFLTEYFCRRMIQIVVWDDAARGNTLNVGVERIIGLFSKDGIKQFGATFFGHLYTFCTSTLGLGALALVCFCVMCVRRIIEHRQEAASDGDENSSEGTNHRYSLRFTVFGIYAFFAVGGTLLLSVLYKFNSAQYGELKDLIVFGRYTDSVAPLAVFLALVFLLRYGYTLYTILGGIGIYSFVCMGFSLFSVPELQLGAYRESPILGLLPWRVGESCSQDFTPLSFTIMSSMVFAMFAVFTVIICCTRRFKTHLISAVSCALFAYTTLYAAIEYLPMRAAENAVNIAPAQEISEFLYNDVKSPPIVSFNTGSRTAGLIQFLNPDTRVFYIKNAQALPETGIIIINNGEHIPLSRDYYDVIGVTEKHTVLAYGETARDYMKYKNTSD